MIRSSVPEEPTGETDCSTYVLSQDNKIVWGKILIAQIFEKRRIISEKKRLCILKFIYSEKATKFCEISTLLLSYVVPVKSKLEISQNFVAFSEYMNFK